MHGGLASADMMERASVLMLHTCCEEHLRIGEGCKHCAYFKPTDKPRIVPNVYKDSRTGEYKAEYIKITNGKCMIGEPCTWEVPNT